MKAIELVRNHAGLWTFGIFVLAVLGGMVGIGAWALDAQKQVVVGIVEKKEAALKGQVDGKEAALKGEIDTSRMILERLESRVDRGFQRMDKRLDTLEADLKLILQRLPSSK